MKQIVQSTSGGSVRVVDVPRPIAGPTEVLVQTMTSVISPGTEGAVTRLAQSSLIAKARARPDLVRQVVKKARTEGLVQTGRAVRARMDEDLPLGYSAAGVALEVGEAVADITPGDLVATGGAGSASHAEFQAVPGLLCAKVPDDVPAADAAFSTIASIALHGLRMAEAGPGARVLVLGLGLVGQLTVRLARAAGCLVAGLDVADFQVQRARDAGAFALEESGEETTASLLAWSNGIGVDAVVVTAGSRSSDAIMRTPAVCRDRACIVVVGDVGLNLARTPFYEKELTLRFARSYGPGRYERSYEDWGVDLPPGFVRWTEGRNLEAILELIAAGRLAVADLVTHRFPITDAARAYELIEKRSEPYLGVQIVYPEAEVKRPATPTRAKAVAPGDSASGIGLIGAGAFASSVLVPRLREAAFQRLVAVASASGISARRLAESQGFERVVSGAEAVIDDPDVGIVVIATPHDTHAALTARALRSGKHVFCEKPLALSEEELADVESAWRGSESALFVGFNRRWSKPITRVMDHFAQRSGPLVITYTVNAGKLPDSHWYHDRRQGGRLLGEVCHFIDTCAALVKAPAVEVAATGSGAGERLLEQDLIVSLRYPDGSLAGITYASGGSPSGAKERIDVFGAGHSASVVDFNEVRLDGARSALKGADKGHGAEMKAFHRAIMGRGDTAEWALTSTRTTLEAAACLGLRASALRDSAELSSETSP